MTNPPIGLVGAGTMGAVFIRKLVEAGRHPVVYDVDAARQVTAAAAGASTVDSARAVAERTDTVLLSVPDSPAVEAAMEGPDGILAAVGARHLIVDTSTVRPATDQHYARLVGDRGGRLVDAPLSWRPQGVLFMVGGTAEDFAAAQPVLEVLGFRAAHCGPLGAGQRTKLVNQFVLAARLALFAEAAHLARKLDLDPETLVSVLDFQDARGALDPTIAVPGSHLLALHTKDLVYLEELVGAGGIRAPLTDVVTRIFQETRSRAEDDWAQPAIVTYWQQD